MEVEALSKVVVDIERKSFYLYSDQGNERVVECENSDQFISVLKVCADNLDSDTMVYTKM